MGGPFIGMKHIDPVYTELPSRIEPLYVDVPPIYSLTLAPSLGGHSIAMTDIHPVYTELPSGIDPLYVYMQTFLLYIVYHSAQGLDGIPLG